MYRVQTRVRKQLTVFFLLFSSIHTHTNMCISPGAHEQNQKLLCFENE